MSRQERVKEQVWDCLLMLEAGLSQDLSVRAPGTQHSAALQAAWGAQPYLLPGWFHVRQDASGPSQMSDKSF